MKLTGELGGRPAVTVQEEVSLSPFADFIGIKIDKITKNYCRLSLKLDEKCTNYFGGIHGGVLASLADNCMGMTLRAAGLQPVTVELTVNFMGNPNVGDRLTAEGLIIHQGNTLVLAECIIRAGDLKNVARGKGVFLDRSAVVHSKEK